jgi:hypothetical protein
VQAVKLPLRLPMIWVEPSMSNTISDVLTRISSIQQQLQQLQDGSLLDSQAGVGGAASASTASAGAPATFANQLAAAQSSSGGADAAAQFGSLGASALGMGGTGLSSGTALSAGMGLAGTALSSGTAPTAGTALQLTSGGIGFPASGSASLPASASTLLTSGQQQFASTLSAETGLNPGVVTAWLLAEESGGAAQSRQAANNNDWLNIGYTDSATYGAGDSIWSDPVAAANATAQWLKGQDSIPGYGTASAGIQSILSTVGQTPEAQIQALQQSGWASGGYPSLGALYAQVAGG